MNPGKSTEFKFLTRSILGSKVSIRYILLRDIQRNANILRSLKSPQYSCIELKIQHRPVADTKSRLKKYKQVHNSTWLLLVWQCKNHKSFQTCDFCCTLSIAKTPKRHSNGSVRSGTQCIRWIRCGRDMAMSPFSLGSINSVGGLIEFN